MKLDERILVKDMNKYIDTIYVMHGLNLALSSLAISIMGGGGILKWTSIQVINTHYNLSQQYCLREMVRYMDIIYMQCMYMSVAPSNE